MAVGHFSRLGAHLLQEQLVYMTPCNVPHFSSYYPRVAAWRLGLGGVVGARCRWARRARGAGRTHTRHPTPHTPTRHCDGVRCGSKYFLLLTNTIPQKPTIPPRQLSPHDSTHISCTYASQKPRRVCSGGRGRARRDESERLTPPHAQRKPPAYPPLNSRTAPATPQPPVTTPCVGGGSGDARSARYPRVAVRARTLRS